MVWKLALAQHPMYLLIREDTQCAERTPPWGAPDIESYIDRVRQNLQALVRYPHLKLGYEWSGVELELLNQDAPEVLQEMKAYAQQGKVQFYNGTYAQPHLQILSSEANLRQFEYGQEAYQELGLERVQAYIHQEVSIHEQLPQLLQAFGLRFAAVPGFLSTLVWLDEGELVLHGVRGPRFVQGHEFVTWQGLDGAMVPLYLHQPIPREMSLKETLARETVLRSFHVPVLMIDMPDMIDIDTQWMAERQPVEFVLINEALEERLQLAPPRSRVRLYTHWSYLEGIRAEELSRTNWLAERSVLRAEALEALAFVLLRKAPESTDLLWKTILSCQHHDAYCFSAPELRQKSIDRLKVCEDQAQRMIAAAGEIIASAIDTQGLDGEAIILFNTLPHPITAVVELDTQAAFCAITNSEGISQPVECAAWEGGRNLVRFPARLPGLGYSVNVLQRGGQNSQWIETRQPLVFENSFYRAVVTPDGIFQSLRVQPAGFELLDSERGGGNFLSATDSRGISLKEEDTAERLQRLTSAPPPRGPQLAWETLVPTHLLHSPLGTSLLATGRMGTAIEARVLARFYHHLPRIDLVWKFGFRQASVGTFFDDDSKLLVRWPLAFSGEISHDIPFGAVKTRPDRPFFPTSWVDISSGGSGIAFFHQGIQKYWVSQDTLFNLLAWGEDTDAIHNGLGRDRWLKPFDQRLNGSHTICSAVYVHSDDWGSGRVAAAALDYSYPPVIVRTAAHPGALPLDADILHLEEPGALATAVFMRGGQLRCRVYAANGQTAKVDTHKTGLRLAASRSIAGEPISDLTPFQIGELSFNPDYSAEGK